jgi:hypothetical protein
MGPPCGAAEECPTEAELLPWLGVKLGFLGGCIFDQLIDPINRQLIRDGGRNSPVLLKFLVEFDAFVTHDSHRICAS